MSILPLWMGRDQEVPSDVVNHSGGGFAIRQGGDWKLEFTTTGDGMDALSDLLADHIRRGRSTPGEDQLNDRNNPTGDGVQISWMDDAKTGEDATIG